MGLSACFPFFSNEISDAKGIYIGLNKEDGSTILLDLFNRSLYNNAMYVYWVDLVPVKHI